MKRLPDTSDTIVARATPPGSGGVAVVRISGKRALEILRQLFKPARPVSSWKWGQMHFGEVVDEHGEVVDQALGVFFPAPRSYTGEDVAELHLHGGEAIVRRVLASAVAAGARPAQPGEFTFRAFLSGRLDLTAAEAVADLIGATGETARRNALKILQGELYDRIQRLRTRLIEAAAEIEAHLDFPEEDIEPHTADTIQSWLDEVAKECTRLAQTYEQGGRRLLRGFEIAIVGAPNVGKSSLLNRLLGFERAITSPQPGTTRDFLSEELELGGIRLKLVDTAGLRAAPDELEQEGVRRAYSVAERADFLLVVWDSSRLPEDDDFKAASLLEERRGVLVLNKADLPAAFDLDAPPGVARSVERVVVSCKTGAGFDRLERTLYKAATPNTEPEDLLIVHERHRDALLEAVTELNRATELLRSAETLEFAAVHVRAAMTALSEITGETTPEDVLAEIFERFCIGK